MSRFAIYSHEACLDHDTGPGHAESPQRLEVVVEALREAMPSAEWIEAPRATRGQLLRVHDPALLARILGAQPSAPTALDDDTVLSPGSAEAALRAAGAGVAAVDAVLNGELDVAFCAVRPPGHHASIDVPMGFCLFDNIAVAAAHALDRFGLARVAIIDFDVHHGNGTQDIFEREPRVMYLSSHEAPLYPGTGDSSERGVGNIVNAPLPAGTGSAAFREAWRARLLPALDDFQPQLLLLSAGFDAHRRDPLAHQSLEAEDFAWATRAVIEVARRRCAGKVVSSLEGGYDLEGLGRSAAAHVAALGED